MHDNSTPRPQPFARSTQEQKRAMQESSTPRVPPIRWHKADSSLKVCTKGASPWELCLQLRSGESIEHYKPTQGLKER